MSNNKKVVAFYGRTGCGASSLINALCGRKILPTAGPRAILTVSKVCVDLVNAMCGRTIMVTINFRDTSPTTTAYHSDEVACEVIKTAMDSGLCTRIRVCTHFENPMPQGIVLRDVPPHDSEVMCESESLRRVVESDALVYVLSCSVGHIEHNADSLITLMRYAPGHFASMIVAFTNSVNDWCFAEKTAKDILQEVKDMWYTAAPSHHRSDELQCGVYASVNLRNRFVPVDVDNDESLDDLKEEVTYAQAMVGALRDPDGAMDRFADSITFSTVCPWRTFSRPLLVFLQKTLADKKMAIIPISKLQAEIRATFFAFYDCHFQNLWYNGCNNLGSRVIEPMNREVDVLADIVSQRLRMEDADADRILLEIHDRLEAAMKSLR
jgi:energy-coupling factor transporter ATP-binding protein EcfA2